MKKSGKIVRAIAIVLAVLFTLAVLEAKRERRIMALRDLTWAAGSCDQARAADALDRGADIEARDPVILETVLNNAAYASCPEMVSLLLDRGADINAPQYQLMTPLMMAVAAGRADTARILIDRGADLHRRNTDGLTALMIARSIDSRKLERMLLDAGAEQ